MILFPALPNDHSNAKDHGKCLKSIGNAEDHGKYEKPCEHKRPCKAQKTTENGLSNHVSFP